MYEIFYLSHVTDGETTERRELGEGLHTHRLAGHQHHNGRVARLDKLGCLLGRLAGTPVALLLDLRELAGNVGRVAIQDGRIAVGNLAGMVENNHLGGEVLDAGGRLVLVFRGNIAALDVLDRDVLDVEAHVVAGRRLGQRLVVHLHRLDLGGQVDGGKGDNHAGLDDASLHAAHGDCSNAANLVHILNIGNRRV